MFNENKMKAKYPVAMNQNLEIPIKKTAELLVPQYQLYISLYKVYFDQGNVQKK